MAVFSRLLPCLASAYGLQTLFAMIFVPQETEVYFDLGGALGFLSTTFISLYFPVLKEKLYLGNEMEFPSLLSFSPRQVLLSSCVALWSTRLGSFLLTRALKAGGDTRFGEIRHKPALFTYYWMAQATWVFIVGSPVYLVNTLPSHLHSPLGTLDYISVGAFAASFAFEVIADYQKTAWRRAKDTKRHNEKFMTSGLWSISRHPNYLGEIGIWAGIYALSLSSLRSPYLPKWVPYAASASPLFTYLLTRYVSGVPPLERLGDKRFGSDPQWLEYKNTLAMGMISDQTSGTAFDINDR